MMDISVEEHKTALNILSRIQEVDPKAVIAGGWARDIILGAKPKDVDIWTLNGDVLQKLEEVFGVDVKTFSNTTDKRITSVAKLEVDGLSVDVIHYNDGYGESNPVYEFDFGICQAWFDGEDLHTTESFDYDIQHKTLTFKDTQGNRDNIERIMNDHLPRLQSKFKDYKLKASREIRALKRKVKPKKIRGSSGRTRTVRRSGGGY